MKKLVMLVLICASIVTFNQSYAHSSLPNNKSSKSVKTQSATKTQNKVQKSRRKQRLHGYNYYKYANSHAYLRTMGKAISGR